MRVLSILCLLAVGCGGNQPAGSVPPVAKPLPKGTWIEVRAQPKLPLEKVYARLILKEVPRPKTVRFIKWGPHDETGKWGKKLVNYGDKIIAVLRVVWEDKDEGGAVQRHDDVRIIQKDALDPNEYALGGGVRIVDAPDRWFGDLPADD